MSLPPRITALFAGCVMFVGVPAPSAAQDVDMMPMPLVEASLGYAYMSHQTTDESERYPRGWYASLAANVTQWFSIVGEGAGSYRSEESTFLGLAGVSDARKREYTVMVGPRVYRKVRRVVPFGQVLTGVSHQRITQSTTVSNDVTPGGGSWTSTRQSNLFALQPGGGVGVLLTDRVGVRVAADYRALFDIDEDSILHEFRIATGFTFHWGGR